MNVIIAYILVKVWLKIVGSIVYSWFVIKLDFVGVVELELVYGWMLWNVVNGKKKFHSLLILAIYCML